jgi:pimeloyl-ACP methyl ester carboxylesterase
MTATTTERVRSRDGTVIAFERVGTGPSVILADAALCFRGFGPMRALAATLAPRFTVFTYDRRGRGEGTDTPPYAVQREVEDLGALIEAAGGSAFVHGFSSGAVLALHAAANGLAIPKLSLLEPPLELDPQPGAEGNLGAEIAELVAANRRGDAVEHFNRSIGVPEEMIGGIKASPSWPTLEGLAHTLVYDTIITTSLSRSTLSRIGAPTLVVTSAATDERLRAWARGIRDAMPDAEHRSLPGAWHGVSPDVLAPVLAEFLT